MPRTPRSKREWDLSDVPACPKSVDDDRTSKDFHLAHELQDLEPSESQRILSASLVDVPAPTACAAEHSNIVNPTSVDRTLDRPKRQWDGYDVRAYPRATDRYKRNYKDQHPARELEDTESSKDECVLFASSVNVPAPSTCEAEQSTVANPLSADRTRDRSKREWDGYDVRAYPRGTDSYKRSSKEQHPAHELQDDEPPKAECILSSRVGNAAELEKSVPDSEHGKFSVCIVGAGGIGCHLAYTLHKAGANVTLVARGENLRVLQTVGLHITICGEEIGPVHIPATDAPESIGHVDYVFLTMKVSGYDRTILETIAPLIGTKTTILPPTTSIPYWWFHRFGGESLSGQRLDRVDPDSHFWSALPPEQVVGFTMWLSAAQVGPGRTVLRHIQRGYPLGELDGSMSDRVERLAAALERGGVPSPRVSNIRSEIFIKSINSLAFNIVAVLGNAINGVIAEVPEAVETLLTVMVECEGMAAAMGIPISQSAEERVKQTLSAHMHTMSMLHDLRSGKKLELRALWESICNLAEVLDVKLPITRALVGCALLREAAENAQKQLSKNN